MVGGNKICCHAILFTIVYERSYPFIIGSRWPPPFYEVLACTFFIASAVISAII